MSLSEFFAIIISNYFLICVSCEDSVAQDIENKEEKEANSDSRVKFVEYQTPKLNSESIHLYESFDDPRYFKSKWVQSEAIKRGASEFKYDGKWDLVATHHRIKGLFIFSFHYAHDDDDCSKRRLRFQFKLEKS